MKNRQTAILTFLGCIVAFSGCQDNLAGPRDGHRTWVATEPIQCLGNSWERDWLAKHGEDYDCYPRDLAGQFEVIEAYYEELGVAVYAIASRHKYSIVCGACSCPRGDTLYILVGLENIDVMKLEGFRREWPSMPGPITVYD
jgi:hypothetical protein